MTFIRLGYIICYNDFYKKRLFFKASLKVFVYGLLSEIRKYKTVIASNRRSARYGEKFRALYIPPVALRKLFCVKQVTSTVYFDTQWAPACVWVVIGVKS
jgi:hypothetical protein